MRNWKILLPVVVGSLALLLTFGLYDVTRRYEAKRLVEVFEYRTDLLKTVITSRIQQYEQVLYAGRALINVLGDSPSRDQWREFVETTEIGRRYPGIQGVGFAEKVDPAGLPEHLQRARQQGVIEYNITPEGNREVYYPIIHLEPFNERNRRAFGYDMFSEPVRRKAMELARDTGTTAMSGKVILVQERDRNVQNGFLIYLPIYEGGEVPTTLAGRQSKILGFVYAPFRARDFLEHATGKLEHMSVQVFEGRSTDPSNLLVSHTGDQNTGEMGSRKMGPPMLQVTKHVDFGSHHWTMVFSARKSLAEDLGTSESPTLLILGIISSALLAMATGVYLSHNERVREKLILKEESRRIRVIQQSAIIANETAETREALKRTLQAVCDFTGWPIGHAYLVNPARLESSHVWENRDPSKFQEGDAESFTQSLGLEQGIPGKVVQTKKAIWLTDLGKIEDLPRKSVLRRARLQSAFAFPVLSGEEAVAVLEFYSDQKLESDSLLLETMDQIGLQLGRVFERERNNRSLRESEERFRSVTQSANDAIVSIDVHSRILSWNQAAQNIFGFSTDEIRGREITMIMPERYRAMHNAGMKRLLTTGESHVIGRTIELSGLRKDGTEFPLELSLSSWKSGGEIFFTGILRDITERKAAQLKLEDKTRELQLKADELMRSNRELEQFAYVASHDLQEPIRMIAGYSTLLAEEYFEKIEGEGKDYLNIIQESSMRMRALVSDLLEYSRLGQGIIQPQPIVVDGVVKKAIENLQLLIQNAGATVTRDQLNFSIMAEPLQLLQLFQNFISNALKFRREDVHCKIHVGVREGPAEWIFSVQDNGIGIDPRYHDKIFALFQRLHDRKKYPGTGIGLSICKKIVENHHGRIWVESTPGEGTTFYFTLSKLPA
jgi:PAS domain S-box-containing protein